MKVVQHVTLGKQCEMKSGRIVIYPEIHSYRHMRKLQCHNTLLNYNIKMSWKNIC